MHNHLRRAKCIPGLGLSHVLYLGFNPQQSPLGFELPLIYIGYDRETNKTVQPGDAIGKGGGTLDLLLELDYDGLAFYIAKLCCDIMAPILEIPRLPPLNI